MRRAKWKMHAKVQTVDTTTSIHLDFLQKQKPLRHVHFDKNRKNKVNIIHPRWANPSLSLFLRFSLTLTLCLSFTLFGIKKLLIPFANKNVRYATTFWFAFIVWAQRTYESGEKKKNYC